MRVLWRRKVRGSRLGRSVECQSGGSMVIREALVFRKVCDGFGIYCRTTENQKRGCIVKIFGVHDPQLRHTSMVSRSVDRHSRKRELMKFDLRIDQETHRQ